MRLVFIDNLLLEHHGELGPYRLQPHLGLISLLAVLEAGGHQGVLFDPKLALARGSLRLGPGLYEEMASQVLALEPDVVGMTALGCNFICVLQVAQQLKKARPELPILLGGPHATVLDRAIAARFPVFDVIVRHEAERTLLPLLDALWGGDLEKVPGITFARDGSVTATPGEPVIADLDSLPRAAYHHYPIRELGLSILRVEAGRGCPFRCVFCSTAEFFGRKYRLKSPEKLCDELDFLNAQYGVRQFALTHDLFTVNRKKVLAFCEAVASRGYIWNCSARPDCVDEELLEAMYRAGCREIYYGIETGSQRMQELSAKHLDLSCFLPVFAATHRIGIHPTVSFITGFPQEELTDQEETLDLISRCFGPWRFETKVQLHLLTPEPGTPLIRQLGATLAYDGHVTDLNFPPLLPEDEEVMRRHPEVFMNHHYYPGQLPRERHVFVTTLYDMLYDLGHVLFAHLLQMFGGSLAQLVNRMYDWHVRWGAGPVDGTLLVAFFAEEFGQEHYATSLVRYMTTALRLAGRGEAAGEHWRGRNLNKDLKADPQPDRYRLSASAAVLRGLHPVPAILQFLSEHRDEPSVCVPAELATARADRVLVHRPAEGEQAEHIHMFTLNDLSCRLLELFTQPRPWNEAIDLLNPLPAGSASALPGLLETLLSKGVLQAA